jgi:cytochrome P450
MIQQTLSAISTCVLGLLSNPEALKKAQLEMDAALGRDQLPNFDDESSLPYVTAIVREGMRWNNMAPLGTQHYLSLPMFPNFWFFSISTSCRRRG